METLLAKQSRKQLLPGGSTKIMTSLAWEYVVKPLREEDPFGDFVKYLRRFFYTNKRLNLEEVANIFNREFSVLKEKRSLYDDYTAPDEAICNVCNARIKPKTWHVLDKDFNVVKHRRDPLKGEPIWAGNFEIFRDDGGKFNTLNIRCVCIQCIRRNKRKTYPYDKAFDILKAIHEKKYKKQ